MRAMLCAFFEVSSNEGLRRAFPCLVSSEQCADTRIHEVKCKREYVDRNGNALKLTTSSAKRWSPGSHARRTASRTKRVPSWTLRLRALALLLGFPPGTTRNSFSSRNTPQDVSLFAPRFATCMSSVTLNTRPSSCRLSYGVGMSCGTAQ